MRPPSSGGCTGPRATGAWLTQDLTGQGELRAGGGRGMDAAGVSPTQVLGGFGAPAAVLWDTGLWGGGVGGWTPREEHKGALGDLGKDLRGCHGVPWGAAQARGTQRCRAFVCKGGSAGAACLRCIPGIPSLLPAPFGRGWGATETGGGLWGWWQPLPHGSGVLVCGSTGGARCLHGVPASLAAVTGPARSCVVQMSEG